ncbi:MAG: DHH family phosphoesterase [Candidatus Micrarchaeota archaeon]
MRRLDFNGLVAELRGLKGRTVVTGHSLEDVDALASSVVLAELLGADVRVIDRENAQAKRVSARLGVSVEPFGGDLQGLNRWDCIVMVDVSNSQMLGVLAPALESFPGSLLAIDHHSHNNPLECPHYVDDSRTSCSEIVLDVADALGRTPTERQASLLALGVVSDTALLKSATSRTIESLSILLGITPLDFREMLPILDVEDGAFERVQSIAALQDAVVERRGDAVLAYSSVRTHEHHAAESLVSLGADVAVALNTASGKMSFMRNRNPAVAAINCGKIATQVASEFGGSGGGHELVAGLAIPRESAGRAAETLLAKAKLLVPAQ